VGDARQARITRASSPAFRAIFSIQHLPPDKTPLVSVIGFAVLRITDSDKAPAGPKVALHSVIPLIHQPTWRELAGPVARIQDPGSRISNAIWKHLAWEITVLRWELEMDLQ